MHENISLGSSGVDRVSSLQKVSTRLRGTNFCTSSAYFAPSFVTQPNGPQCTQIVQYAPKHQFRVQWGWIGCVHCEKFRRKFVARTFALLRPILHRVPCSIKTLPNAPKCYTTQENKSLGSIWLDRVCSLRKIPRRLHGTNLCINCTKFCVVTKDC